jgi:hypothetical protein
MGMQPGGIAFVLAKCVQSGRCLIALPPSDAIPLQVLRAAGDRRYIRVRVAIVHRTFLYGPGTHAGGT